MTQDGLQARLAKLTVSPASLQPATELRSGAQPEENSFSLYLTVFKREWTKNGCGMALFLVGHRENKMATIVHKGRRESTSWSLEQACNVQPKDSPYFLANIFVGKLEESAVRHYEYIVSTMGVWQKDSRTQAAYHWIRRVLLGLVSDGIKNRKIGSIEVILEQARSIACLR